MSASCAFAAPERSPVIQDGREGECGREVTKNDVIITKLHVSSFVGRLRERLCKRTSLRRRRRVILGEEREREEEERERERGKEIKKLL